MLKVGISLKGSLCDTNPSEAEAVAYDKYHLMRNAIVLVGGISQHCCSTVQEHWVLPLMISLNRF